MQESLQPCSDSRWLEVLCHFEILYHCNDTNSFDRADGMWQQIFERLPSFFSGIAYDVEEGDAFSKLIADHSADVVLSR